MTRPLANLWQDYLFLTREMSKSLRRQDFDLFNELLDQRERLQVMIDAADDDGLRNSAERRELIAQIKQENGVVVQEMAALGNRLRRQNNIDQAYSTGRSAASIGGFMDRQS